MTGRRILVEFGAYGADPTPGRRARLGIRIARVMASAIAGYLLLWPLVRALLAAHLHGVAS